MLTTFLLMSAAVINLATQTLLEATLTLYPADNLGQPILSAPIWRGVAAERLTITDQWLKVETRPTGAPYPKRRALVPQYRIAVDSLWALPIIGPSALGHFGATRQYYVLDVVWEDEETEYWHRETYYGVTIAERERSSREIDTGHNDHQVFEAEYLAPPTSGRDAPGPISSTLPLTVNYVDSNGVTPIYSYNASTEVFSEMSTGISAGKATLSYVPNRAGVFEVRFNGAEWPALRLTTDGTVEAMDFFASAPDLAQLPRVDFYYGPLRIASVAATGRVFATRFVEESITPGNTGFELFSNSAQNALIGLNKFSAKAFRAFAPAHISGLKLWCMVDDLSGPTATIARWRDRSGNADLQTLRGNVYYVPPGSTFFQPPLENDGAAAVLFDKDTVGSMKTSAAVVEGFDHCVFVVAKPGQREGISGHGDMAVIGTGSALVGDTSADGQWLLALENFALEGNQWTDDGVTRKTATGTTTTVGAQLMKNESWRLLEMETLSSVPSLTLRMNGAQQGTVALTGTLTDVDVLLPIYVGAAFDVTSPSFTRGSLDALVRAVVVYEGVLSAEDKAKVRAYLNLHFGIY